MADPNNIPQEAQQLKEALNTPQEEDKKDGEQENNPTVADTSFEKEYEIAQRNENGSGSQSSDPNPVNRKGASEGGRTNAGESASASRVDDVNSPGDSDPDDYMDMAKAVTKNVKANQ